MVKDMDDLLFQKVVENNVIDHVRVNLVNLEEIQHLDIHKSNVKDQDEV